MTNWPAESGDDGSESPRAGRNVQHGQGAQQPRPVDEDGRDDELMVQRRLARDDDDAPPQTSGASASAAPVGRASGPSAAGSHRQVPVEHARPPQEEEE